MIFKNSSELDPENLDESTLEAINDGTAAELPALHIAALEGHLNTVRALLEQGADPLMKDTFNQTALFHALFIPMQHEPSLMQTKIAIFTLLNSTAPGHLLECNANQETVFHPMTVHGFDTLFNQEIQKIPQVAFMSNQSGRYLIHTAILHDQYKIAQTLLAIENVWSLTDNQGQCALHYAAQYQTQDMLLLCCQSTPDLNRPDHEGNTPLMLAIMADNPDNMVQLLKLGASKEIKNDEGDTAEKLAMRTHHQVLIDKFQAF